MLERFFFTLCRVITKLHYYYFIRFSFKQEGFESKYDIHESYNPNNENPYQSILELPNVDYLYVGYYYCVKNATVDEHLDTLVDTGQASNIYLFVEGKISIFKEAKQINKFLINFLMYSTDPQHPIVKVDNPFLNGAQYQDIIIPCKPTSKMWEIQLIKEGDEVKFKMPQCGEHFRSVTHYVCNK